MKCNTIVFIIVTLGTLLFTSHVKAQTDNSQQNLDSLQIPNNEKLVVIWTSGDRDVAIKMVFMYTYNAKNIIGGMILH